MKRLLLIAGVALLVTIAAGSVGYAITQLYRQVASPSVRERVD